MSVRPSDSSHRADDPGQVWLRFSEADAEALQPLLDKAEEYGDACEAVGLRRDCPVEGFVQHHRNNAALAQALEPVLATPKPPMEVYGHAKVVMLAGPIKHWWDDNWGTPAHLRYVAWREKLNDALVAAGYLVYRPHEAFKGAWNENAQVVNDAILRVADAVLNLSPEGVPSEGTDAELAMCAELGKVVVDAPPPADDSLDGHMLEQLLWSLRTMLGQ